MRSRCQAPESSGQSAGGFCGVATQAVERRPPGRGREGATKRSTVAVRGAASASRGSGGAVAAPASARSARTSAVHAVLVRIPRITHESPHQPA
eukprot:364316-Chlamydomonas_euryale.AAC.3